MRTWLRRLSVTGAAGAALYSFLRWQLAQPAKRSMREFDPDRVAYYEKESWAAYYLRRWLDLGRLLLGLIREQFGLNWVQGLYAAYWATRAQLAFAPQDNNLADAEDSMRRFYEFVGRLGNDIRDPASVARQEIAWWVVHRQHFGHSQDPEVTTAVANLYATLYGLPVERVTPAAQWRAQAMVASDAWVQSPRDPANPLLNQVETDLRESYRLLREAVHSG